MQQIVQGMGELGVRELVAGAPAFWNCHDQAATTKASKVIGHTLPGYPRRLRQVGRVTRRIFEGDQDLGPRLIRQGMTESSQHRHLRKRLHANYGTSVCVFTKG